MHMSEHEHPFGGGGFPASPSRDLIRDAALSYRSERDAPTPPTITQPRAQKAEGVKFDPIPLRRAPPPGEAFPVEALGVTLGGAVSAIASRIQCPPALAGSSVLGVTSLAAQAHADVINPATGAARPLSLFLAPVAESGSRKSGADHVSMRPVRDHEKTLQESYDAAKLDYRRALRAFEVALANAEKKKGDRYEIEAALKGVGDPPREPLLPFLHCQEPTVEGLYKLYERGQPSQGLFSDEGGSFLGGHAMSAENRLRTLAELSRYWDGAPVRRIRAGDGASVLHGRRLALHLMLQPEVARGLFADRMAVDQGFLSRVLVSAPPSLAGTRMQKPVEAGSESALRRYELAIRELLERPVSLMPGSCNSLDPRRIQFDPRATALWLSLADEIEAKLGPGGAYDPIRGFANKLGEHIARIAGVLALADNPDAQSIDAETLGRAAVLGDFFASEALRLFEAGAVSPEIAQAEKLLAWLQAWPEDKIGLVAIYQFGPNSIRDREAARRAVSVLESHGWLRRLEGTGHRVSGHAVREAWAIVRKGG
jgi:Protein of unknown function (DUF3987)